MSDIDSRFEGRYQHLLVRQYRLSGTRAFTKTALAIGSLIVLSSGTACVSQSTHDRVLHERDSLKTELDGLVNGAPRLLGSARAALTAGNLTGARDTARLLLKKHPSAVEAKDAQTLADSAEQLLTLKTAKAEADRQATVRADSLRMAKALVGLVRVRDDVNNSTTFYPAWAGRYVNTHSAVLFRVTKPDNEVPMLSFHIRFVSDSWLFISSYKFKIDNATYEIEPSGYDAIKKDNGERGNGEIGIWEWYSTPAGSIEMAVATALIKANKATIRHSGRQYYKDRDIGEKERAALQQMLDAYVALGGTITN